LMMMMVTWQNWQSQSLNPGNPSEKNSRQVKSLVPEVVELLVCN